MDEIDVRLKEILVQIASDNNFTISEIESDSDHIHLLVNCTPHHSIPGMIKALKGVSARRLFEEFPTILKKLCGDNQQSVNIQKYRSQRIFKVRK